MLGKKPDRRTIEESSRVVHAIRMARRVVRDRGAVLKLFDELAPASSGARAATRASSSCRQRPGDAAPMSLLELMPDEGGGAAAKAPAGKGEKAEKAAAPAKAEKAAKGESKGAEKAPPKKPKK